MAEKIVSAGKSRIAVVDFTDLQGNVTEFGRFIAEEFSVALASAGKGFTVVDRTHLQSILKEHELSQTGLIDPQTARELGKITGVEALITGTITPFGESVRLAVKILDTKTAEIIDAQRGNIPKTQAIEELLGRIAPGGLASSGQPPSSGPAAAPPATEMPALTAQQSVEEKDFIFKLQRCIKEGEEIACHILVTSLGQDREILLYGNHIGSGSAYIIDEFGTAYNAKTVKFGKNNNELYVRKTLFADIPTGAVFWFEEIPEQMKSIAMLVMECKHNNKKFAVKFPNISLSE